MPEKELKQTPRTSQEIGIPLTPEKIDAFLSALQERGCVQGTVDWYRRGLTRLYQSLPDEKLIYRNTLKEWKDDLVNEGYAANTINTFLVAADGYLEAEDAREYQAAIRLRSTDDLQPELSRAEYLRLLRTAKELGRERVYLLVKLFATTAFPLQELHRVTVESVGEGKVTAESNGVTQFIRFPEFLQKELLSYAKRNGILHGPIFISRNGIPMSRTNVHGGIRQLSIAAQVAPKKGNYRCLNRLCQTTRAEIEASVALLAEQTLARKLEDEQLLVGWEEL